MSTRQSSPEGFATFIATLDQGRIDDKLRDLLAELVLAVADTGKPGKLTVELTVTPEAKAVSIGVMTKRKIPEHPLHRTLLFADDEGRLSREDPRQQRLPLRGLEPPARPRPIPFDQPIENELKTDGGVE